MTDEYEILKFIYQEIQLKHQSMVNCEPLV